MYVIVRLFIRRNGDTRLKQHTKSSVSEYLSKSINEGSGEAWQKKQVIDAISLLFKSINAPLYQEIDWDYWKSSCLSLGPEHDTHYRSTHPITSRIKPSSLPQDSAQKKTVVTEINSLRTEVRRMNDSIRTEKGYTDWVQKFLEFNRYQNRTDIDQHGVIK
jgi:hypothetical protein